MSDMGRTSWWSHRTAEAPHAGLPDSTADSENARPPPKNSHLDSYRAREILRLDGWRRRKEGRRDRGDGDHLPQRHRGRSWSTRFYPFWRWHPPSISPPPPHLAAAAYVMPMSCLVTRAIFPNISENAFAMRFSCLQDTFFTFFFFARNRDHRFYFRVDDADDPTGTDAVLPLGVEGGATRPAVHENVTRRGGLR